MAREAAAAPLSVTGVLEPFRWPEGRQQAAGYPQAAEEEEALYQGRLVSMISPFPPFLHFLQVFLHSTVK